MTLAQAHLDELILGDKRHREYPLPEYIAYCEQIRTAVKGLPKEFDNRQLIDFFEKDFVEEMEVLARICKHQFPGDQAGITIQYIKSDPPDGIITLANGDKIYVECTSAIDRRWEHFALEQWRRNGKLFSLSGFEGADIEGNRNAGYSVKGVSINDETMEDQFVEAEDEQDTISKHRRFIEDRIERKLRNPWEPRKNWLCIFVNEYMIPQGYACMEPILNKLCVEYKARLRDNHIAALYFASNRCDDSAWMSFHPTDL